MFPAIDSVSNRSRNQNSLHYAGTLQARVHLVIARHAFRRRKSVAFCMLCEELADSKSPSHDRPFVRDVYAQG